MNTNICFKTKDLSSMINISHQCCWHFLFQLECYSKLKQAVLTRSNLGFGVLIFFV